MGLTLGEFELDFAEHEDVFAIVGEEFVACGGVAGGFEFAEGFDGPEAVFAGKLAVETESLLDFF